MRIGFISYEYAGVGAGGGIGTYVRNAAQMMSLRGHDVEVFCSADYVGQQIQQSGLRVNAIQSSRDCFSENVRSYFSSRHGHLPFDVIEGPEYGADASGIRTDHPSLALVVRLHTPAELIEHINNSFVPISSKARFILGALRRGKVPKLWWQESFENDAERLHTLDADAIASPSDAIAKQLVQDWKLPSENINIVPNAFEPSADLLKLVPTASEQSVLFLGRLEVRKGVMDLAKSIPRVLKVLPNANFTIVGRDLPFPGTNLSVGTMMRRHYRSAKARVTHLDAVENSRVPALLGASAIAVFPSVWEAFGYVLLEAMAAGRAVIGSSSGGMAEIIEDGRTGLLVPPHEPKALADAIIRLLKDPTLRHKMGLAAREHVIAQYNPNRIGPLQEHYYQAAIINAKKRIAQ